METTTNIVNYTALAMAVWLGMYLVTRSSRSQIAWLSALTLWSTAGVFLNSLLALNPPPSNVNWPAWTTLLLPFWSSSALQIGWTKWLQGWLVIPAVAFWHHATILMLPGKLTRGRRIRLSAVYAVAVIAILFLVYTPWLFERVSGDPLTLDAFKPGPLLIIFLGLLVIFTILCIGNLLFAARSAVTSASRNQVLVLAGATTLACLTSLVAFFHFIYNLHLPSVILSILLGCAVFLMGFGVARYSALTQGRTMMRDFSYNATAMAIIAVVYMTITWFSVQLYMVPPMAFIFVLILVIVSHSLVDFSRRSLDLLFFRKNTRDLRANLRELSRLVGEKTDLSNNYAQLISSICDSIKASSCMLVLFTDGVARVAATCGREPPAIELEPAAFCCEDIQQLAPGHLPDPLSATTLMVPLYSDGRQLGTILLGCPENGVEYSDDDIDLLYYSCDQLALFISYNLRKENYLLEIEQLALNAPTLMVTAKVFLNTCEVEACLRSLYDYAVLGDSSLARLVSIQDSLATSNVTHLDRGRAVHSLLVQGIEKLRPEQNDPCGQPSREWYPYLILRSAYIEDQPNRNIMSHLYISEGTFNRTRRAAIRAVTRALNEMAATEA